MKDLKLVEKSETSFDILSKEDYVFFSYQYFPEYQLTIQKWFGSLQDEQIIEIYKQAGFFAYERRQQIVMSITDIQETENSFHLTNTWVAEEFIPKSIPLGYKYVFFVRPAEFFAELALEDAVELLSNIEGLTEVKIFDSPEEAFNYAKEIASQQKK